MTNLGPNAHLVGRPGSRAELMTPALLIDLDALERNIAKMADFCRFHGVALRPHAKTHKSVTIARMQIAAGAIGVSVATLGEAEVMASGGIPGVLITSPVVTPAKIGRLLALDDQAGVSDESRPGKTQAEFGPRLGSGRETFVAMMKSTGLREGNDLAWTRRLFRVRLGTVFSERPVSPGWPGHPGSRATNDRARPKISGRRM